MIERKVEIEKDNVRKFVDVKLLSDYLGMGWSKVELQKEIAKKSKEKSETKKSIIKKVL